jgi:ribonuclease D
MRSSPRRVGWRGPKRNSRAARTRAGCTGSDDADAFLRIKGARELPPRALAILREVHAWRESVAEARDQAPFRIMSNEALLDLGRQAPTTPPALRKLKSIPGALADRWSRDLLAAVARGMSVPESECPRFPESKRWERDPVVEHRAESLREARTRVADALNLDPGFLVSRAMLDEVARRNPGSVEQFADIPGLRQWQVAVLADEFVRALRAAAR